MCAEFTGTVLKATQPGLLAKPARTKLLARTWTSPTAPRRLQSSTRVPSPAGSAGRPGSSSGSWTQARRHLQDVQQCISQGPALKL